MKTTLKKLAALLTVLALALALCACGGTKEAPAGSAAEAAEDKAEEKAEDLDFLLGMWFADTASQDDVTVDAEEVFGGTFSLYFSDDGKCTMAIDQQRALLDWELTENGVTLKGDNTYEGVFQDAERTTMIMVINGIDVHMEKYQEG